MGIEYYWYALFVAILLCLVAILCKFLFANVKQQHKVIHKMLDEKESKLLRLYQDVEEIMEEFTLQAKSATEDIKDGALANNSISTLKNVEAVTEKKPEPPANDSLVFKNLIDVTVDEPLPISSASPVQNTRNGKILAMKSEGKTSSQIAQELGITQNEVLTVIGLTEM